MKLEMLNAQFGQSVSDDFTVGAGWTWLEIGD